jgi:hypothetical protein
MSDPRFASCKTLACLEHTDKPQDQHLDIDELIGFNCCAFAFHQRSYRELAGSKNKSAFFFGKQPLIGEMT